MNKSFFPFLILLLTFGFLYNFKYSTNKFFDLTEINMTLKDIQKLNSESIFYLSKGIKIKDSIYKKVLKKFRI